MVGHSHVGPVAASRVIKSSTAYASYSNCILWLDAADATTVFRDAGGTVPAVAGDVVNQWKDKSAAHNHALADKASATLRTDATTGRTLLRGQLGMSLTNPYLLTPCAGLTVCIVLQADQTQNCLSPFCQHTANYPWTCTKDNDHTALFETLGMAFPSVPILTTSALNWATTTAPWSTWYKRALYVVTANTTAGQTTIFKSDAATVAYSTPFLRNYWTNSYPVTVGWADTFTYNGDAAEILVFNTALSSTTSPRLADVAAGLRTKWAITQ